MPFSFCGASDWLPAFGKDVKANGSTNAKGGEVMVSLAISAYIRHTKRNCFIILQLTVLFIVLLVTVTTICEEYRWYRPVADWNGKRDLS